MHNFIHSVKCKNSTHLTVNKKICYIHINMCLYMNKLPSLTMSSTLHRDLGKYHEGVGEFQI